MKKSLLILSLCALSSLAFSQELILGDFYSAEAIHKLLNSRYSTLKDPKCLSNYLSTADYKTRISEGSKIRSVNVCSEGRSLRINIRFDQMGGTMGSVGSINTILNCALVKHMPAQSCYDY